MPNDSIIFQLATHYLPRRALRLECLLLTIEAACNETHPVIHHYALNNIFEILKFIEKPELKSRFLKELMQVEHALNHKAQPEMSNSVYAKLFVQIQVLNHLPGRFGETIHIDPFLQSIKLAQAMHSNDCELYSPQLLLWLELDPSERQTNLINWLKQLRVLYDTVVVYLSLLRDAAQYERIKMQNGFYQRFLPAKTTCHLILLKMNKHSGLVPKMQIGNHGFNLRLCEANSMKETQQTDTEIELAICQL